MSNCPNPTCGAEDPLDSDFCRECGEYLRIDEPTGMQAVRTLREPAPAPAAAAPEPTAEQRAQLGLEVAVPGSDASAGADIVVEVDAGGRAVLVARVRNQAPITEHFRVSVEGLPEGWSTVTPDTLRLNPVEARAADAEGSCEIALHPPRSCEAEAHEWPLTIVARSTDRPAVAARVPAALVIAPFTDSLVETRPDRRSARRRARYDATITNRGNAPVQVGLAGADEEEACLVAASPAGPVAPGDSATVRLTVRARRRRWFGRPVDRLIALDAQAADGSPLLAPPAVIFRHRAWFPWWIPPVVLFLLALALLLPRLLPKTVVVPDVRNAASPFEAQRLLAPAGLRVAGKPEVRMSDRVAPGTVLAQTPNPGARAKTGSAIALVVAAGTGRHEVPDLRGKTLQEADAELADAGLKLGAVQPKIDYAAKIAEQLPAAGQSRPDGTPVDVTLAAAAPAKPPAPPPPGPDGQPKKPPAKPAEPTAPLAYDDAKDIYVLSPGESSPHALTTTGDATEPAWAPDGQALAYRREVDGKGQIYVLHPAQGDAPGQPLSDHDHDYSRPAFSPDGATVAYVKSKPDYDLCFQAAGGAPSSASCVHDAQWAFNRPTWAPDGKSVLVLAFRRSDPSNAGLAQFTNEQAGAVDGWTRSSGDLAMEVVSPQFVAWGPESVALMAGAGGAPSQLTLIPVKGGALVAAGAKREPVFGCEIAWRPDGALAVANHPCLEQVTNGQLVVFDPKSAGQTPLTVLGGNPAWAPTTGAQP